MTKIINLISKALFSNLSPESSLDASRKTIGPNPKSITFDNIPTIATRLPNSPKSCTLKNLAARTNAKKFRTREMP